MIEIPSSQMFLDLCQVGKKLTSTQTALWEFGLPIVAREALTLGVGGFLWECSVVEMLKGWRLNFPGEVFLPWQML